MGEVRLSPRSRCSEQGRPAFQRNWDGLQEVGLVVRALDHRGTVGRANRCLGPVRQPGTRGGLTSPRPRRSSASSSTRFATSPRPTARSQTAGRALLDTSRFSGGPSRTARPSSPTCACTSTRHSGACRSIASTKTASPIWPPGFGARARRRRRSAMSSAPCTRCAILRSGDAGARPTRVGSSTLRRRLRHRHPLPDQDQLASVIEVGSRRTTGQVWSGRSTSRPR